MGDPVWLFSSGPIGTKTIDSNGNDVVDASIPKDFAEFAPLGDFRDWPAIDEWAEAISSELPTTPAHSG